ncbi:MAG: hypothetical protein JWM73_517 [Solirubrobacterales bacterium]|nr:hypothetical protein [Solirubrobacterales bacterium]
MPVRTRRLAAVLSATALLGGAGLGVAEAAKTTSRTQSSTSARPAGDRGGPIPSAALAKIATTLGVSTADLKAALDANRPAAPAGSPPQGGPGDMAADLADALGVQTSAVQTILDANRPAKPATRPAKGTRPPRPDATKLIAALASGLNLDQATVTAAVDKLDAAHKADRQAHETAMYAALATALNKTAADVQAAFEANRPAPPAG